MWFCGVAESKRRQVSVASTVIHSFHVPFYRRQNLPITTTLSFTKYHRRCRSQPIEEDPSSSVLSSSFPNESESPS
jgi:hypothetical protein